MRRARAWTIVVGMAFAAVMAVPRRAEAVTLKEIMELTRSGVSDEVILALIEIDQRVFPIDSETLGTLKQAGVSERVMVAIVKSGRATPPQSPSGPLAQDPANEPPPPPQVFVVERESPSVREVVVPVPVYIAVPTHRSGHDGSVRQGVTSYDNVRSAFVPFGPQSSAALPSVTPHPEPKPREPVYWGWGGKRRPDTWDPDPQPPSRKQ
jgi:hypothetical protein